MSNKGDQANRKPLEGLTEFQLWVKSRTEILREGISVDYLGEEKSKEKSLGAARQSLTCIRLFPRGQSCLHALSTGCGPDVCDIRTSYVSRQCISSDGDNVAPCLLRRLAAPFLLRGLATPYLLRRLAAPYLLRRLATPYLLRRLAIGTLTRLLSSLEDITKNIDMTYLPKRRWSNLEKKRAHFMIKDITKLLKERRMIGYGEIRRW
ncbi:hypothetical protein Tco_0826747 [Tanacetum coccineum]